LPIRFFFREPLGLEALPAHGDHHFRSSFRISGGEESLDQQLRPFACQGRAFGSPMSENRIGEIGGKAFEQNRSRARLLSP
jgi:hypothetical protein